MSSPYEVLSCCCICLGKDSKDLLQVTSSKKVDTKNSWFSKLRKCISEIEWSEEYMICQMCRERLDAVYDFHVLCIQSHETRKKTVCIVVTPDIKTENDFNDEIKHKCGKQNAGNFSQKPSYEPDLSENKANSDKTFSEICCLRLKKRCELEEHHEIIYRGDEYSDENINDNVSDSGSSNTENHQIETAVTTRNLRSAITNHGDVSCDINQRDLDSFDVEPIVKTIIKPRKQCREFICEVCKHLFNTSTKLIHHAMEDHNIPMKEIKPFACSKCPMRFNRSWGLTTHAKSHNRGSKRSETNCSFICEICEENFINSIDLISHCVVEHKMDEKDVRPHSCIKCMKRFPDRWRLKEHVKSHNEESNIKNNVPNNSDSIGIDVNNTDVTSKVISVNANVKKKTFTCEICGCNFNYCTELVKHMVKEHKMDKKDVKPFICTQCSKRFDKNTLLVQHTKFHDGIRNAICPYCGKAFITKGELHIHEKTHLNKREYQCTLCPKRFNTSGDRNRHKLVVHTDPSFWKYVCNICTKRLPSKSHYDTHMRRHNNDKPFACHLCEKRFCDKIVLQKHLRSHSNVRPYKCSECAKEYKDERTMQLHMGRIHKTGNIKVPERVKKYICHLCPKSYYDKGKLTKHLYSHTGERPFACTICYKKFTDKSYVKHHMKTVHNFIANTAELSH